MYDYHVIKYAGVLSTTFFFHPCFPASFSLVLTIKRLGAHADVFAWKQAFRKWTRQEKKVSKILREIRNSFPTLFVVLGIIDISYSIKYKISMLGIYEKELVLWSYPTL